MADYTLSPNMSLSIPTVGVAPGPDWATLIDACFTTIDAHTHTSGSGVPITPSAININTDLTMAGNNLTQTRSLRFLTNASPLALGADIGCIYESGVDLYYNDGNGVQIRLTQAGAPVGTPGSITGLPSGTASASYSAISGTFVWQSATNTAANMDFGSAVMRNTSPNSTFSYTLSPPAALAGNVAATLPNLPGSSLLMSMTSSGVMGFTVQPDNSSIYQVGNSILVKPLGITGAMIADATIPLGKLAAASVSDSNMVPATITGASLAANIDLPAVAKVGGRNIITSGSNVTNNMSILRRHSDNTGANITGEGITLSSHPATGIYVYTFNVPLYTTPVITTSCFTFTKLVIPIAASTTGCTIATTNVDGTQIDVEHCFIAIG